MARVKKNRQAKKIVRDSSAGIFVIKALGNEKYDYRTAEGIAKESRAPLAKVNTILKTDKRVRASVMKSKSGKQLYALKTKKSAVGDFVSALRAISSYKLES